MDIEYSSSSDMGIRFVVILTSNIFIYKPLNEASFISLMLESPEVLQGTY